MKVNAIDISSLNNMTDLVRVLNPFCSQTGKALNNGLSFQDNIRSSVVPVSFPSTANQNLQVSHGLPATPIGYIAIRLSAACIIYDGFSLVLGATFANLKCSVAGITATILFF
jgi:hypothetical protein